jgi:hypothetical protein
MSTGSKNTGPSPAQDPQLAHAGANGVSGTNGVVSPIKAPPVLPSDPVEAAQLVFAALGYSIQTRDRDLILEAALGSRGHRVLLAPVKREGASTKLQPSRWKMLQEAKKVWGAKYLALLLAEGQAPPQVPRELGPVTMLDANLLPRLANITLLAPIGPLELEGYWNGGGLTAAALDALGEQVRGEINARGSFSGVVVWLATKPAHTVVTVSEVLASLSTASERSAVLEALDTLSRAPFRALIKLNPDEYYIRQSIEMTLVGLADYAAGLRTRMRATVKH